MTIYTKRGDKGMTGLFDPTNTHNKRISKSSKIINAIGAVDEANSYMGVCIAGIGRNVDIKVKLEEVQRDLFTIGSILAGAKLKLPVGRAIQMERDMDVMEGRLPILTGFILPGGNSPGADLFYARSLVRRAERAIVSVPGILAKNPVVLVYINRLSDYLFVLARHINAKAGIGEKKWKE